MKLVYEVPRGKFFSGVILESVLIAIFVAVSFLLNPYIAILALIAGFCLLYFRCRYSKLSIENDKLIVGSHFSFIKSKTFQIHEIHEFLLIQGILSINGSDKTARITTYNSGLDKNNFKDVLSVINSEKVKITGGNEILFGTSRFR